MINPGLKAFMHILLTLVILLSLLLNCLLIFYIVKKSARLRCILFKEKLILSLALSDLLRALVGYTMEVRVSQSANGLFPKHCYAPAFAISFFSYTAIHHFVLITFDRWIFIAKPMRAFVFHNSKLATTFALFLAWALSLLFAVSPFAGFGSYDFENGSLRCSVAWSKRDLSNRIYHVMLLLFCFILPLLAMVVFYVMLRRFLRRSCRSLANTFGSMTFRALAKSRIKAEGRVASMFFTMASVFVISWSPYGVLSLMNTFSMSSIGTNSVVQTVAVIPAKASTLYNPVIIAWYDRPFQRFLRELRIPLRTIFMKYNRIATST